MTALTVSASRNLDDALPFAITGSITSSTSSTTLTGTGTTFNTTNTPIGSPIYSGTNFIGIVSSITNTTTIVLTANAAVAVTNATDGFAYRGLALLNGEAITIDSGATLTINSDNRWAQQAAVIGRVDVNDGSLVVDGTQVWWVPFDASTGNVPPIGTNGVADVTVNGVSRGEFLEIFTGLGVSPSTAGTAMPATGFVKLRRKIGTINDNDVLTFANGATVTVNSATGGQRGWLHIVNRENVGGGSPSGFNIAGLASTTWTGDWFELGTTNGNIGQQIQYYVADLCPALQIETSAGSGVYEWWQHMPTTQTFSGTITTTSGSAIVTGTGTNFSTFLGVGFPLFAGDTIIGFVQSIQSATQVTLTTNALAVVTNAGNLRTAGSRGIIPNNFGTDVRNNFFSCNPTSGIITFFGATAGRLPPSGAKIRVPNIHTSTANPSNYDLNVLLIFPSFGFTIVNSNGAVTVSYVNGQHRYSGQGIFDIRYSGHIDGNARTAGDSFGRGSEVYLEECVCCQHLVYASYSSFFLASGCKSVTFKNCFMMGNFLQLAFDVTSCDNVTFNGGYFFRADTTTVSGTGNISGCTNVLIENTRIGGRGSINQTFLIDGCTGVTLKNWTYVGRQSSTHSQATRQIGITNTTDILWDGYQYWIDPPNNFCTWSNCSDVRIRNIGTASTPFLVGSNFSFAGSGPITKRLSMSNIYISGSAATTPNAFFNLDSNFLNACYVTSGSGQFATYVQIPGYSRRALTSGSLLVGGTAGGHFGEQLNSFSAPTQISLIVSFGSFKDLNDYRSAISFTDDVGTIKRDGTSAALINVNDQATWTWTYPIKGITSFVNATPSVSGSFASNVSFFYDLDRGTGFTGTFKSLTGANISAETNLPATGLRLRIRAICNTASVFTRIGYMTILANTNTASIANNPYPNNEAEYTITGTLADTRAAIFRNSDGALLYQASKTAPISLFCDWYTDTTATLRVRKPGYNTEELQFTLKELGGSIPISQTDNAIPDTNPGSKSITITNHGASPVTWNSKQWSITITVTDGSSAATIANWLSWNQAQDSFSFDSTRHNMSYHDMVVAVGTSYETARGTVFGSAGAALKGVRVIDGSGNEIPGFVRMQADDGTYYVSPTVATITVSNLVSGDRVLVARDNGSGAILKDEYTPVAASTGATSIQVVESIKTDTPTSGVIRIKNERYTYSGYNTGTKTFSGLSPALTQNIVAGDDVFVPFIDKATTTTSESVTFLYSSTFGVTVDVRNGSATPIIPFRTTASVTSTGASINTIRTADI